MLDVTCFVYVPPKGHGANVKPRGLTAWLAEPDTFNFIPTIENICFSVKTSKRANRTPEDYASALHSDYLGIRGCCMVFRQQRRSRVKYIRGAEISIFWESGPDHVYLRPRSSQGEQG